MIGRRSVRTEVRLRRCMDQIEMRILAVVGSKQSENLCRWRGKGSLTMSISQGLVDPNCSHNMIYGKGKKANIPLQLNYKRQRRLCFWYFWIGLHNSSVMLTKLNLVSIIMMRSKLKLGWVSLWGIKLIPWISEKETEMDIEQPYQEPALVPLGEKPKAWRCNPIEGTRQISPVRSQ